MAGAIHAVGDQVGGWTILDMSKGKFLCRCHCGVEKWLDYSIFRTESSECKSCASKAMWKKKRGVAADLPTYVFNRFKTMVHNVWKRCLNPNNEWYRDYGGRGILICQEWIDDKNKFILYLSQLPNSDDESLMLDRINNDGHYEPGNLRFTTCSVSNYNRREFGHKTSRTLRRYK